MQRNKYLDDLGLDIKEYGTNFLDDADSRSEFWKEQRETYGFDSRECWNLNHTFAQWLYSHLMMYLEEASEVICLDFYEFVHNDVTYTQQEAIEYIIDKARKYILMDEFADDAIKCIKEFEDAVVLFSKILPVLWW